VLFQDRPEDSGMYNLDLPDTAPDARPVKLPFFGSWRWQSATRLLYIPYEPGKPMTLHLYDLDTGKDRALTDPAAQPFKVLNDDWSVAPDGSAVLYWDAGDRALWLITLTGPTASS
jgi:hypothetical protein